MRRDGCHTCGRRRGKVVGDHIPPNKMVLARSSPLPDSLAQLLQQPLAALQKRPKSRHAPAHMHHMCVIRPPSHDTAGNTGSAALGMATALPQALHFPSLPWQPMAITWTCHSGDNEANLPIGQDLPL